MEVREKGFPPFQGDVPSVPEADSKDIVIYAAIGVVVVAVIAFENE